MVGRPLHRYSKGVEAACLKTSIEELYVMQSTFIGMSKSYVEGRDTYSKNNILVKTKDDVESKLSHMFPMIAARSCCSRL